MNNKTKTFLTKIIKITVFFTLLFTIFGYNTNDWNGIKENEDETLIQKLFNRYYFSMISLTTVGFGDITPNTFTLKMIMIIYSFVIIIPIYELIR